MKNYKNKKIPSYKHIIRIFTLLNLILFVSCEKDSHYIKKEFYSTGELLLKVSHSKEDSLRDGVYKEFYKNGNLKQLASFQKNVQVDSAMSYYEEGGLKFKEIFKEDTIFTSYYYRNGNLSILNTVLKGTPPKEIGWTKVFNKNKIFIDSLNYMKINGKRILNQRIHYKDDGLIELDSSTFYRMKVSKIKNTDKYQFRVSYFPSVKDVDVLMVIGKDISNDFSNLESVKLDTLLLENNTLIANLNKSSQNLKGFFYEYKAKVKHEVGNDSVRMSIYEKKTYFDEHIKVTDTIELGRGLN